MTWVFNFQISSLIFLYLITAEVFYNICSFSMTEIAQKHNTTTIVLYYYTVLLYIIINLLQLLVSNYSYNIPWYFQVFHDCDIIFSFYKWQLNYFFLQNICISVTSVWFHEKEEEALTYLNGATTQAAYDWDPAGRVVYHPAWPRNSE